MSQAKPSQAILVANLHLTHTLPPVATYTHPSNAAAAADAVTAMQSVATEDRDALAAELAALDARLSSQAREQAKAASDALAEAEETLIKSIQVNEGASLSQSVGTICSRVVTTHGGMRACGLELRRCERRWRRVTRRTWTI